MRRGTSESLRTALTGCCRPAAPFQNGSEPRAQRGCRRAGSRHHEMLTVTKLRLQNTGHRGWKICQRTIFPAAFLGLSLLAGPQPYPEFTSRSVQGTVTDSNGRPVSGAAVELQNLQTLGFRSFITTKSGKYHFEDLYTDDDYRLRARYCGTFGPPKKLSRFNGRKNATINLTVRGQFCVKCIPSRLHFTAIGAVKLWSGIRRVLLRSLFSCASITVPRNPPRYWRCTVEGDR